MPTSVKEMLAEANASVPRIAPEEAKALLGRAKVPFVDVRDGTELQATGKVKGAVHVPRGLLGFKADPESPAHDANFDRDRTVVLYCGAGGRAALAGRTLQQLGYREARNLGGFKEWVDAGGEVERG